MRGIRSRLLLSILPVFALFWCAGAGGVYVSVSRAFHSDLDVELRALIEPVQQSVRMKRRVRSDPDPNHVLPIERALSVFADDQTAYYQVWDDKKQSFSKSPSLEKAEFSFPEEISERPSFANVHLEDSTHVRTVAIRIPTRSGRGLRRTLMDSEYFDYMVGMNRGPLDTSLRAWLVGLALTSIVICSVAATMIIWAVTAGLKPLSRLSASAGQIDARSLATRFDGTSMPKELKPIAEALNDLLARLERSFARERQFSADLAHELRTPVATLRSLGEVALKWPEQATDENYNDVVVISDRMTETIESMLLLARLEEDSFQPKQEPVDLNHLLDRHCKSLAKSASKAGVTFDLRLHRTDTIETDSDLLGIVICNLLRNAVDHAPPDSQISVSSHESDGTDNILSFANSAPDLSSEDVPHLFDRFWRRDQSRTSSTNSGLGLSIARTAAIALGFDLCAELTSENNIIFRLIHSQGCSPGE